MKLIITFLVLIGAVYGHFAPLQGTKDPHRLFGRYIVVYEDGTTLEQAENHWDFMRRMNVVLQHTYCIGDTFKGFAASFDDYVLSILQNDPIVDAIHCDANASVTCDSYSQNVPSWGLARVSYGGSISSGMPDYYNYNSATQGSEVDVYVLDTGIFIEHIDFGGRAVHGANFVDTVATDQNGHGTHCAGIAGGTTFGIAKQVRLIAVKVLSVTGSGSFANIIKGIDFVTASHNSSSRASVALMPIGGSTDGGLTAAIASSVQAGVVYSVPSGNSNANACNFYPASSPDVITTAASALCDVGIIDQIDCRSSSSNYGTCVKLFAPGVDITSAGISSRTASAVYSGSSMACAHVAGQVAVELSANPKLTPVGVRDLLFAKAQKGIIQDAGAGSPNALLYNSC